MHHTHHIQEPAPATAAMKEGNVLSVHHLYKSFGNNHVLNDFNLEVAKGESVAVLGKSGSGKSVLIKCIIGLLKPDAGEVTVFGMPVMEMSDEDLDQMRAKVGFLFQSNALYDSMTVRQNLEFPLRRHWIKVSQKEVDAMVMEALRDVDLEHTIDMMPAELSGGMRKRIAFARTLILKPEIILYDEPTTGLDPMTGKEIIMLIRSIQKKYSTTSLIISHDMTCVRMASDKVAILHEGRCYAFGSFEMLKASKDPVIEPFFE
jgi:phospholipid/cholesterol/gamma-HCH transport system ATP-binding protein